MARTITAQAGRDFQDRVIGKRLLHVRTPLQRRLDAARVDLVWFPTTYVEDVDLPYIATVFDLEHRQKPWFPEVTLRGEFERRDRYVHPLPAKGDASHRAQRGGTGPGRSVLQRVAGELSAARSPDPGVRASSCG